MEAWVEYVLYPLLYRFRYHHHPLLLFAYHYDHLLLYGSDQAVTTTKTRVLTLSLF